MVCKACPKASSPIGDGPSLGFAPLTEAAVVRELARHGLGRTAFKMAVDGAQTGARRGSWQSAVAGAALGLGIAAWAFWRGKSEDPPPLPDAAPPQHLPIDTPGRNIPIRANATPPSDPPVGTPLTDLATDITQVAAANDPQPVLDFAKVVSAPFQTQREAEAELVRLLAAETQPHSAPYAVIHDTQTGYFYVCEITGSGYISSSFRYVAYGVKLGETQSEADAIPSYAALVQANGEPLRVIGVWSPTQFVITTTKRMFNTLGLVILAFNVKLELFNNGATGTIERIMLSFPDRFYVKIFVTPSDLEHVLKSGIGREIEVRVSVQSTHPITGEPFSMLKKDVKLTVTPGVKAVTISVNPGMKSAHIEHYESGERYLRIPDSSEPPLTVYIPIAR